MFKHHPPNDEDHLENQSTDVPRRCMTLEAKEAEDKHLLLVHSINHVNLIKNISSKQFNSKRHEIASKLGSIYFNEGSSQAVYLATNSIVKVVKRLVSRELDSVVAIVRPSGDHAKQHDAMGFFLFNNVAVAARYLLDERPKLV